MMRKLTLFSLYLCGLLFSMNVLCLELYGKAKIDPTALFIKAVTECTPGVYFEKNLLYKHVGPSMLKHVVKESHANHSCLVIMSTPDGKKTKCSFDSKDLEDMANDLLISGLVEYNIDKPSPASVKAELIWSEIKTKNCDFDKE
jgi:hypothetical protein